jgi:hypothetical protein
MTSFCPWCSRSASADPQIARKGARKSERHTGCLSPTAYYYTQPRFLNIGPNSGEVLSAFRGDRDFAWNNGIKESGSVFYCRRRYVLHRWIFNCFCQEIETRRCYAALGIR